MGRLVCDWQYKESNSTESDTTLSCTIIALLPLPTMMHHCVRSALSNKRNFTPVLLRESMGSRYTNSAWALNFGSVGRISLALGKSASLPLGLGFGFWIRLGFRVRFRVLGFRVWVRVSLFLRSFIWGKVKRE